MAHRKLLAEKDTVNVVTQDDLSEIFPSPAVREVAFEIRFAPRLRIIPEVWRIQDSLAEHYPTVGQEASQQPDGRIVQSYVFANPTEHRHIKVSQENFIVVFNQYGSFEQFKAELLRRVTSFVEQFEVQSFHRVGLRYVNHISLKPQQDIQDLRRYVNLPVDFDRFDPALIEQFLTEFRLKAGQHSITVRGALLQSPTGQDNLLFILDLDCYTVVPANLDSLPNLLEEFHHHIQVQFLEHVSEEYKQVMRRKA